LIENRPNVGGSQKRLQQAKALLCKGQVEETKALFADCKGKQVQNFCRYLDKGVPRNKLSILWGGHLAGGVTFKVEVVGDRQQQSAKNSLSNCRHRRRYDSSTAREYLPPF
jgi:hypothetical protein